MIELTLTNSNNIYYIQTSTAEGSLPMFISVVGDVDSSSTAKVVIKEAFLTKDRIIREYTPVVYSRQLKNEISAITIKQEGLIRVNAEKPEPLSYLGVWTKVELKNGSSTTIKIEMDKKLTKDVKIKDKDFNDFSV